MLRNPYEYQTTATPMVDNGKEEPAKPEMVLHVTQERLERLKVGIWRKAQKGDVDSIFAFLAHFMIDGRGVYMPLEAAYEVLDEFELGELEGAMERLKDQMEEAAVPKASGGTST